MRRAPQILAVQLERASTAQFLGGHARSAAPVRRNRGLIRQPQPTIPTTASPGVWVEYPVTSQGPYDPEFWYLEWNNTFPEDGYPRDAYFELTLDDVDGSTSIDLLDWGYTGIGDGSVLTTITGGPFTTGQTVTSPIFTMDITGFDSADTSIPPEFSTTACSVWILFDE